MISLWVHTVPWEINYGDDEKTTKNAKFEYEHYNVKQNQWWKNDPEVMIVEWPYFRWGSQRVYRTDRSHQDTGVPPHKEHRQGCNGWYFRSIENISVRHRTLKQERALIRRHMGVLATQLMMTSSNGNIFRVTGPLYGEFTGPGEFPAQRPVM